MIITLTGFMGCGKTTAGEALAGLLGWKFFDLDAYLEHKWACSVGDLFKEGELKFRAAEAEAVRDLIIMSQVEGDDRVIALGGGTFANPVLQDLILENTTCVWLRLPLEVCLSRIDASTRPMLSISDAASLYESRLPHYARAEKTVDVGGMSAAQVAAAIKSLISPAAAE